MVPLHLLSGCFNSNNMLSLRNRTFNEVREVFMFSQQLPSFSRTSSNQDSEHMTPVVWSGPNSG